MTGAVRQLVKGCAVIGSSVGELLDTRERDAVAGGVIASFVTVLMMDGHTAALDIISNHRFGLLVCAGDVGKLGRVLCRQSFALGKVKHAVIAEEGNLFLLAGAFVFLFDPLPEDNHLRFFALPDMTALGCALMEGDVLSGLTQKHLIEKGIGLARAVTDGLPGCNPRLEPRNLSGFKLRDDPVCNGCVNVHSLLLFLIAGSKALW